MMFLFVKLATEPSIPALVFTRFALATPLFLWLGYRKKVILSLHGLKKNAFRSLAGIGALYASYYSLRSLPLVNAVTLASTAPLFLPLIYLVMDKHLVPKKRIFAAALGFVGVCIMLRPTSSAFFVLGSITALSAGFFRAIAIFNIRKLIKTESAKTILAFYFIIGTVLSWIPMVFDWRPFTDPVQWLYLLIAGFAALGFQYALTNACKHLPATKVSSINYLGVLSAGILGWLIFHEVPDLWLFVGACLIVAGSLIALFDQSD